MRMMVYLAMMKYNVENNQEESRFEIVTDKGTAVLEYLITGDDIALMHTEVPENFEGKGAGSALASYALQHARTNNLQVKVYCPFVKKFIERHPELMQ